MGTAKVEEKTGEETAAERLDKMTDGLDSTQTDEEKKAEEEEKKTAEETKKAEEDAETKVKEQEEEEAKKSVLTPDEDNRELRQVVREQRRQMSIMQAKLDRIIKRPVVKAASTEDDLFKDEEKEKDAKEIEEELSKVEQLHNLVESIGQERGPVLETLVEAMEQNPKFEDIRTVCSQANFDDIFEAVGKSVAEKEGSDPVEAQLEFEAAVWTMANPYKYMYGLIKEYHRDYTKTEEEKKNDDESKTDTDAEKNKTKPAKAPTSIAEIGGGGESKNTGWTAERIDNLPEDELEKVPKDVYDKYLSGDLDK